MVKGLSFINNITYYFAKVNSHFLKILIVYFISNVIIAKHKSFWEKNGIWYNRYSREYVGNIISLNPDILGKYVGKN